CDHLALAHVWQWADCLLDTYAAVRIGRPKLWTGLSRCARWRSSTTVGARGAQRGRCARASIGLPSNVAPRHGGATGRDGQVTLFVVELVLVDDVALGGDCSEVAADVEERPAGVRLDRVVPGGLDRDATVLLLPVDQPLNGFALRIDRHVGPPVR